jgi:putative transposase
MSAAAEALPTAGVVATLDALGLSTSTFYRLQQPSRPSKRRTPARALSATEQRTALDALHEERFQDRAPAEVVAALAKEGRYVGSERTLYRLLAKRDEVRERRNQLVHPNYAKPELVATAPNQVWSWDITKLLTTTKLVYLYLYVVIDIYSRYVVGWLLAERENAALATRLIDETVARHDVKPGTITLHADRGAPMRSKLLSQLLAELDVNKTFNRPHTSNDNPYSESHFKTLKYHPGFPRKLRNLDDGLAHCRPFFAWYNGEHHHSGIELLTPCDVHFGHADVVLKQRHDVMMAAYAAHPERFVHGPPRLRQLPSQVAINPPSTSPAATAESSPTQPSPASVAASTTTSTEVDPEASLSSQDLVH